MRFHRAPRPLGGVGKHMEDYCSGQAHLWGSTELLITAAIPPSGLAQRTRHAPTLSLSITCVCVRLTSLGSGSAFRNDIVETKVLGGGLR